MMLIFDVIRGPHSTGMAFVNKSGDISLQKKLGNPFELLDSVNYDRQYSRFDNWIMMGHNRWATKGKINKANAHPFEFSNVVGAHNGTLRSTVGLHQGSSFDVDSEAVMWNVEVEGISATLPKLQGAYALTIYDARDEALYLARNIERPLHFCYTKDNKTIFWASEPWMLEVALGRCKVEHGKVMELKVGSLLKIDRSGVGGDIKVHLRNFEVYKPPLHVVQAPKSREMIEFAVDGIEASQYNSAQKYIVGTSTCKEQYEIRCYAKMGGPEWDLLLASTKAFSGVVSSTAGKMKYVLPHSLKEIEWEEVDDTPVLFVHPDGSLLDAEEWRKLKDEGCAWCNTIIDDEDAGDLGIYLEAVVCPKCAIDLKVLA